MLLCMCQTGGGGWGGLRVLRISLWKGNQRWERDE